MTTVTETCACGATFTTTTPRASDGHYAARRWREEHQHAESVGICGERPPPLMLDGHELARPHCVLKAGHTGLHADGRDGHWSRRPKITNHRAEGDA